MKQALWTKVFAAMGEAEAVERINRLAELAKAVNPNPDSDVKSLQKALAVTRSEAARKAIQAEIDSLTSESMLTESEFAGTFAEAASLAGVTLAEAYSKAITKLKGDFVHPVKQRLDIVGLSFEDACEKLGIDPEDL